MTARTDEDKRIEQERIAADYQASVARRRGQGDGVIVTPVEIVDWQLRAAMHQVAEQGRDPDHVGEWLDPFGGTGIYTARLLQICALPPPRVARLATRCVVIEIDREAAQIAANNLARVAAEETNGQLQWVRVICTDTFTLVPDADLWDPDLPLVLPNTARPSFTCPKCQATSYNPNDLAQGYCGQCHEFTGTDTSRDITESTT